VVSKTVPTFYYVYNAFLNIQKTSLFTFLSYCTQVSNIGFNLHITISGFRARSFQLFQLVT